MPFTLDCSSWRQWIRPVFIGIYLLCFTVTVEFYVWHIEELGEDIHRRAWMSAGVFMLLTIPISLWDILQHLFYFRQPDLQKPIFRILWMVPIYTLGSWVTLFWPKTAIYFHTFRECYEAYVICNFMILLTNYVTRKNGGTTAVTEDTHSYKACPLLRCCFPLHTGEDFVSRCKLGVFQYIGIKLTTTVVTFICHQFDLYHEGNFGFKNAYVYLLVIDSISQTFAMTSLYIFHQVEKEKLKELKPGGKFVCVKSVIFLTFWQSIVTALLMKWNVIPKTRFWEWESPEEVATGLQDFLVCIEMLGVAIAQHFYFSHKPYVEDGEETSLIKSLLAALDVSDLKQDTADQIRHFGQMFRGWFERLHASEKGVSSASPAPPRQHSPSTHVTFSIPEETGSTSARDSTATSVTQYPRSTSVEGSVTVSFCDVSDSESSRDSVSISIPERLEDTSTKDSPQQSSSCNNNICITLPSNSSG